MEKSPYLFPLHKKQERELLDELNNSWLNDINEHYLRINEKIEKSYKTEPADFFKFINSRRGNKTPPTSVIKHDGKLYNDPEDILRIYLTTWEKIYHPNPPLPDAVENTIFINNWHRNNKALIDPHPTIDLNLLDPSDPLTAPFDLVDLAFSIGTLKKKTPGESGIAKPHLKHFPLLFLKQLLYLYNATLSTGYMPILFKTSNTVLIPKKGDHTDPKNQRPIALLEALAKVFETIMYR